MAEQMTRRELFRRGAVLAALGAMRALPVAPRWLAGMPADGLALYGPETISLAPVAAIAAPVVAGALGVAEDADEIVGVFE
jgi:hypothetical protein